MRAPLVVAAVVGLLSLLCASCSVDQQKEVQLYRDVLDSNVPAPTTQPFDADAPLSLREALTLANQNNEQLGLRGEDYVQALIAKNRAVAAFLPTVSFQPAYTIEERPSGRAGGTAGLRTSGDVAHRFEAPVVGSINFYRGGADVANVRAAEANIEQRRQLLLDLQTTVMLNVAQTYYQVLRSEQSADVLANSLKTQEARAQDVEQQFRNGLATRLTVLQSQAQVDATRVTLIQAQSDARNGRSVLANVVGVPAVRGRLMDEPPVPLTTELPNEREYEQQALENRQDVLAARSAVEVSRQNVKVAVAQYYPSVSLNVEGFLYREYYADATRWDAILSANLPIFSAGLIRADVRTAWSLLRQAALSQSAIERQALNDVQVAYENLKTSEDRVRELQDQTNVAAEALQQAQNAYRNSLAINLDVLTAQDQLLNTRLQLTSALLDRTVFYMDLLRATGQLPAALRKAPTTMPATHPGQ